VIFDGALGLVGEVAGIADPERAGARLGPARFASN
jgi:hypothetical protein